MLEDLISHLANTSRLEPNEARRVVREVLAYCSETTEEFVVRRHLELQAERLTNPVIFERLSKELQARRFRAAPLSARQLRRIIYG